MKTGKINSFLALVALLVTCNLAFISAVAANRVAKDEANAPTDKVYIEDLTTSAGQSTQVMVKLNETASVSALQFTITIPDGFTVETNANGRPVLQLASARQGTDHAASGSVSGNKLNVMIYSAAVVDLPHADAGDLVSFNLNAAEGVTGEFELTIDEVLASDTNLESVAIEGSTATITIQYLATSVALNKNETTLIIGETETLSATVLPEEATQEVVWETSNSDVATVDLQGLVTAVSAGTAKVWAKTTDGSEIADTCLVTVNKPLAQQIELNKHELSLYIDETEQLTVTVSPDLASQDVVWGSLNPEVATVDNEGNVVAVAEGEAKVFVSTTDGSELADTCVVTVTKRPVPVTNVSFAICVPKYNKVQLAATVLPEDATITTLQWESADPEVATVDEEGKITGVELGTTTITVKTTDGSELQQVFTVNVVEGTPQKLNDADVNNDGIVNVGDVAAVYKAILGTEE